MVIRILRCSQAVRLTVLKNDAKIDLLESCSTHAFSHPACIRSARLTSTTMACSICMSPVAIRLTRIHQDEVSSVIPSPTTMQSTADRTHYAEKPRQAAIRRRYSRGGISADVTIQPSRGVGRLRQRWRPRSVRCQRLRKKRTLSQRPQAISPTWLRRLVSKTLAAGMSVSWADYNQDGYHGLVR